MSWALLHVVGHGLVQDRACDPDRESTDEHEAASEDDVLLTGTGHAPQDGDNGPWDPPCPSRVNHEISDKQRGERISKGREVAAAQDGHPGDERLESQHQYGRHEQVPYLTRCESGRSSPEPEQSADHEALGNEEGGEQGIPQNGHAELGPDEVRPRHGKREHVLGRSLDILPAEDIDHDKREDDHASDYAQLGEHRKKAFPIGREPVECEARLLADEAEVPRRLGVLDHPYDEPGHEPEERIEHE